MWPWEHAAVGYLAWSVLVHVLRRRPPTGVEAVVVVLASVLPDLVDKPLGWEFGVFSSGYGAAHSVFFAIPVAVGVTHLLDELGRREIGAAFAVGYLSHLPGDLFVGFVREGRLPIERVLWPIRTVESSYPGGFSGTLREYLRAYAGELLEGDLGTAAVVGSGALAVCVAVWLYDGAPVLREIFAFVSPRNRE
ncbi:metal-dependent hydrolase [Halobellus salinisoli]|uniref:metal-dependent hydrolase n=1 Tax=Halobellus salinisoli TaxID=3108500 RepID=UPI00300959D0